MRVYYKPLSDPLNNSNTEICVCRTRIVRYYLIPFFCHGKGNGNINYYRSSLVCVHFVLYCLYNYYITYKMILLRYVFTNCMCWILSRFTLYYDLNPLCLYNEIRVIIRKSSRQIYPIYQLRLNNYELRMNFSCIQYVRIICIYYPIIT